MARKSATDQAFTTLLRARDDADIVAALIGTCIGAVAVNMPPADDIAMTLIEARRQLRAVMDDVEQAYKCLRTEHDAKGGRHGLGS